MVSKLERMNGKEVENYQMENTEEKHQQQKNKFIVKLHLLLSTRSPAQKKSTHTHQISTNTWLFGEMSICRFMRSSSF